MSKIDLKSIKSNDLPSKMKNMRAEQGEKYVQGKMTKRLEIQNKIKQLIEDRRKIFSRYKIKTFQSTKMPLTSLAKYFLFYSFFKYKVIGG